MTDSSDTQTEVLLPAGSLWSKILTQTQHGLDCGALQPIPTKYEMVPDAGVVFQVRLVTNLERKQAAKKLQQQQTRHLGEEFNPFLPYEPDLFVADLTPTHLGLLNKFNVVDHHLLIVTRAFERQDTLLTVVDFAALWLCLKEYPSLGFYNGGTIAGASQCHKHLQVVPLPFLPEGPALPIAPLIEAAVWTGEYGQIPQFPFLHGLARLDPNWPLDVAALQLQHRYLDLLQQLGNVVLQPPISVLNPSSDLLAPYSYNLLVTRDWLLVVPRAQEKVIGISINSLGFAGALLVKNHEQLEQLKTLQPLTLLGKVGIPRR
jgi:sulfate adenylyltransferase (ADP) / ATP adenylyltransferase